MAITVTSKKHHSTECAYGGITGISHANLDTVREYVHLYADFGYELHHYYQYHGLFFLVSDGKESLSMVNADVKGLSLNETVVALWCDGPVYAAYLTSAFEFMWERSVDATKRILELLKEEDPPIEGH